MEAHLLAVPGGVVEVGGERPHGHAELVHRRRQLGRRVASRAQVAHHVAGEHARVADREVHMAGAALEAIELGARGAPSE
jgi:hypothetical protein